MNFAHVTATFAAGFLAVTLTLTAYAAPPPDLIAAVKSGDSGTVKSILRSPDQFNARDARGNPACTGRRWRATSALWRNCWKQASTRASPTTTAQLRCIMASATNAL